MIHRISTRLLLAKTMLHRQAKLYFWN